MLFSYSMDIKACKSIKISISKILLQNNTFSTMLGKRKEFVKTYCTLNQFLESIPIRILRTLVFARVSKNKLLSLDLKDEINFQNSLIFNKLKIWFSFR